MADSIPQAVDTQQYAAGELVELYVRAAIRGQLAITEEYKAETVRGDVRRGRSVIVRPSLNEESGVQVFTAREVTLLRQFVQRNIRDIAGLLRWLEEVARPGGCLPEGCELFAVDTTSSGLYLHAADGKAYTINARWKNRT